MSDTNTKCPIPTMLNFLGKSWRQPELSELSFKTNTCYMSQESLAKLYAYNTSNPSGVYEGKMWKSRTEDGWELCWYETVPDKTNNGLPVLQVQSLLIVVEEPVQEHKSLSPNQEAAAIHRLTEDFLDSMDKSGLSPELCLKAILTNAASFLKVHNATFMEADFGLEKVQVAIVPTETQGATQ